jgi:hypothetical protein
MATQRHSIRKITFPFTPDTFQTIVHPLNYLVYILPYATSILLYNDITNPLVTRTFKPNERFVEIEILDSDPNSPNYNKHVIDDYIKQGIFSKIPLSFETTSGVPGVAPDPAVFNVETIHTLFNYAYGNGHHLIQNGVFKRDTQLVWLGRYSLDGTTEFPRIYYYDLVSNILNFDDVDYDTLETWYYRATNVVLDSQGSPWLIYETPNIGTPANYDYHLTTYNDLDGTINMMQVGGGSSVVILNNQATQLDFSTLLIDVFDNKYLCTYNGMYKVVGSVLTLLFAAPPGRHFKQAEYSTLYDTFLIKTQERTFIEITSAGDVVQDTQSQGQFPVDFASGSTVAQFIANSNDGLYIFDVRPYLSISKGIQLFTNTNTAQGGPGFIDGDQNTAEVSLFDSMVLKYDTADTDIYFVDILDNQGV